MPERDDAGLDADVTEIVALSRFGQFSGLTTSRSPEFEHIAPVDSWTCYGAHYASPHLSFVPVEQYSNVLVNATANPEARASYRKLRQLTPAQRLSSPGTTRPGRPRSWTSATMLPRPARVPSPCR